MQSLLLFLLGAACGAVLVLRYRIYELEHRPEQAEFLAGKAPAALPAGFLPGTVPGFGHPPFGWIGKDLRADGTGINVLMRKGARKTVFPFTTRVVPALRDGGKPVLILDYSGKQNPWWLRRAMDELVETRPGEYIGKAYLRLPGFPCTLAYFRLKNPA